MINDLYPGKRKRQNVYVVLLLRPFNRILGNEKKKKTEIVDLPCVQRYASLCAHVRLTEKCGLPCVQRYTGLCTRTTYRKSGLTKSSVLYCTVHVPPSEIVDSRWHQCYCYIALDYACTTYSR